jgi:hypothetical protein
MVGGGLGVDNTAGLAFELAADSKRGWYWHFEKWGFGEPSPVPTTCQNVVKISLVYFTTLWLLKKPPCRGRQDGFFRRGFFYYTSAGFLGRQRL